MTRMLYRLGGAAAAHPWRVMATWLVVVVAAVGLAATWGGTPQDDWDVPGASAQEGTDLLRAEFPAAAGALDRVVVHDRGRRRGPRGRGGASLRAAGGPPATCSRCSPPRVSQSTGRRSLLDVPLRRPGHRPDVFGDTTPVQEAAGPTLERGLQWPRWRVARHRGLRGGTGEVIGVLSRWLILLLAFGSVVAAGLPSWSPSRTGLGSRGRRSSQRSRDVGTRRRRSRHGRPRRRHRLRAAAGHPARRGPARGARAREARPRRRHRRPLGGRGRRDRAGLPAGPGAVGPADLRRRSGSPPRSPSVGVMLAALTLCRRVRAGRPRARRGRARQGRRARARRTPRPGRSAGPAVSAAADALAGRGARSCWALAVPAVDMRSGRRPTVRSREQPACGGPTTSPAMPSARGQRPVAVAVGPRWLGAAGSGGGPGRAGRVPGSAAVAEPVLAPGGGAALVVLERRRRRRTLDATQRVLAGLRTRRSPTGGAS